MRLWIDLANSPHVPFFKALIDQFVAQGHQVETTARDFAETLPMAQAAGLDTTTVGSRGGGQLSAKAGNLMSRAWGLAGWARKRGFDVAVSHNSYSQILAARALKIRSVTLMDYEYQPANHLAFRLTSRLVVPISFPDKRLKHYGASAKKIRRYHGTKEDVYLARFKPDAGFPRQLTSSGIDINRVLVLMRPPADDALYHRFKNQLFDKTLKRLLDIDEVLVILLPRNEKQRLAYGNYMNANFIIPRAPLDGPNLIAACDLVISAGGTINREAAALGVPAASIYAGRWAAVDEQLLQEGRLRRLTKMEDFDRIKIEKKKGLDLRRSFEVIDEVAGLILN